MNVLKKPGELITLVNEKIAYAAALLIYGVIAVIMIEVLGRYFFNHPTNWSYDMSWMLYGVLVFLGGAYGIKEDVHVKADIIYDMMKPRAQAIIRIICYLAFFFPFAIAFANASFDLALHSYLKLETSPYTSWNPVTWPVRTIMFVSAVMLLLQGIVDFAKYFKMLKDGGESK